MQFFPMTDFQVPTPKELGYYFPAEWAEHRATWLSYRMTVLTPGREPCRGFFRFTTGLSWSCRNAKMFASMSAMKSYGKR